MTMDDAKVIIGGSLALLVLFFVGGAVYAHGLPDLWAIVRRYVMVNILDDAELLPGELGSGSAGGSATSRDVLPAHGHQAEALFDGLSEAPQEAPTLRQLSRNELIVLLAVQRKDDGEYLFTGNDIKKFVGGRSEIVGNTIATVRGEKPKPAQGAPLKRPAGGW